MWLCTDFTSFERNPVKTEYFISYLVPRVNKLSFTKDLI